MFFKKNYQDINVTELNNLLSSKINLIDVREISEFRSIHIKSAKNVPLMGLLNNPQQFLKKDQKYYLVCQSGARSARACSMLSKEGYDVINISGGTGVFAYKHRENIG